MLKKRISRGTLAGFWLCLLLTLILRKSFLFFFSFSILDETKQIDCESWIKIHCLLQEYTVFQSQQDYLKIHGSRMNPQNCKNEQDRSNPSPLIKKKKKIRCWHETCTDMELNERKVLNNGKGFMELQEASNTEAIANKIMSGFTL